MIVPFEEAKKRVMEYARSQPLNKADWDFKNFDEWVKEWTDFYHYLGGFLTKRSGVCVSKDYRMTDAPNLFKELGIIDPYDRHMAQEMADKRYPDTFDMWGWFEAIGELAAMQNVGLDDEDIDITNI